jgi:hypothetical protein
MSESMESMYRRGVISRKQMGRMAKPAILNKTTSQASKMAAFDGKGRKDEGGVRDRGEVPTTEINHPTNQKRGKVGAVSKGGGVGKGGQPSARAIDQDQTPKFPAGGTVKKNAKPVGRRGLGGASAGLRSSGPHYGGPSSRANG